MLHKRLITKQTDAKGEPVKSLLVLSSIDFDKEMYLAILMDRQNRGPVLVYSTEGGMDIEAVAAKDASKVVRRPLQYLAGITDADAAAVSADLGIAPPLHKKFRKQLRALYKLFCFEHATQVEINPLVIARNPKLAGGEQDVFCVDAKLQIDDNAPKDNRRVATTLAQGAEGENDARTELAQKMGLSYIPLDGNIGCMVNGAGLAMATMDVIAQKGARPANFLDVGGGADEAQVKAALELILSDEKVRVILVNIFGGILRCDVLARGIVGAARAVGLRVPMVVRLEGTNSEEGRRILSESGLEMHTADNMDDAAQIAVELCGPEEVVGK